MSDKFNNPKMTATAVIVNDEGKALFVKRNHEPFKDAYDFVGGFCDGVEAPEQALHREIKEELSVRTQDMQFIGHFEGTYEWEGESFPIVSACYLVRLEKGQEIKLDEENSAYEWLDPRTISGIAFDSNRDLLSVLISMWIDFDEVKELIAQLDDSATNLSYFDILSAQLNGYVARIYDAEKLIAFGCIFPRQTFLRKQAVIEDMIVHSDYRRKGYGTKLLDDLCNWAYTAGVEMIELTSNPKTRCAANELYKNYGFFLHETNHYLLDMKKKYEHFQ